MPGLRQGSSRPAWEHPRDLVKLLHELRAAHPTEADEDPMFRQLEEEGFQAMVDIAWMHDLLEDGRKEDGTSVSADDLRKEGFAVEVVEGVVALTHNEGEQKVEYLARLIKTLKPKTAIVKCVDRICNLREGKPVFKDRRWARYVRETDDYIMPLLGLIQDPERSWLQGHLVSARDARPVVEGL